MRMDHDGRGEWELPTDFPFCTQQQQQDGREKQQGKEMGKEMEEGAAGTTTQSTGAQVL